MKMFDSAFKSSFCDFHLLYILSESNKNSQSEWRQNSIPRKPLPLCLFGLLLMSPLLFATDLCRYALQNPFSCFYFVFTGKMSKWQVVTHRQSGAAAAAASSTTFPSFAFFQNPFSDQMNQSNDNQQISKASVAPVLIWIAIDVTIGSKKATT
jgi:hypothetical protein